MTSKGQVTIPAAARRLFGVQAGHEFNVTYNEKGITFLPMSGWKDTLQVFEKIRRETKGKNNSKKLRKQADEIRARELEEKYFGGE